MRMKRIPWSTGRKRPTTPKARKAVPMMYRSIRFMGIWAFSYVLVTEKRKPPAIQVRLSAPYYSEYPRAWQARSSVYAMHSVAGMQHTTRRFPKSGRKNPQEVLKLVPLICPPSLPVFP